MRKKIMTFLLSSMLLAGCGEKAEDVNVEKDCGCDATVTEFIIPEDEPLKGAIYFVEQDIAEEMSFKYVLSYGGSILPRIGGPTFYICNDELIPQELKREDIQDSVYFSGKVSKLCDTSVRGNLGTTFNHIILTKLEKK